MDDLLREMLGLNGEVKPKQEVTIAMLLRHALKIAEAGEEGEQEPAKDAIDGIATEPDEIRVRNRIEPLGGS